MSPYLAMHLSSFPDHPSKILQTRLHGREIEEPGLYSLSITRRPVVRPMSGQNVKLFAGNEKITRLGNKPKSGEGGF